MGFQNGIIQKTYILYTFASNIKDFLFIYMFGIFKLANEF